jgi:peptidase M28-like protein/PA domain-containing protein
MTELSGVEKLVVDSVSRERLMKDTESLSQWVRLSGSEEERRAFDYVEDALRGMGLETERHMARAYVSLPQAAQLEVEGKSVRPIAHSMSTNTPEGGLELPLIYLGSGTDEDYAVEDVRGKVVLVDGMAMPAKVQRAERAGAAACVFANADEHVHEMIVSGVWGSPTPETRARLPRIPVTSVGAAEAETLHEILREHPDATARLVTIVDTRWTEIPTLIAQVDGTVEPDKFVLFSGHIDSWHYGAMDNGSANATMLETLRVLLPHRATFHRSLRLAFWSGHSHGRYAGSTWYADNFWEDLHDNCVLHLNADSTGGRNATVLTEAHAMAETRDCAADVIRELTGVEFTGTRFGRAGDQSFMGHGIPSLFMSLSEQPPAEGDSAGGFAELIGGQGGKSGGLGWWWHTTEDTLDKIDPELLVRDTRIYAAIAYRFLSSRLVPLDVRAAAEELLEHLRGWQRKAPDSFDLAPVVARAEEVADLADLLQERLDSDAETMETDRARRINELFKRAVSAMVRLNYTQSDPFDHDSALSQPPVPLLAPVDRLLDAKTGSDAENEILTLLVRRRNRVLYELAEARHALRDSIDMLADGGSY